MWGLVNVFGRQRTSTMMRKQTTPLLQSWNHRGPIRSISNPLLPPTDLHQLDLGHLSTQWISPLFRDGWIYSWPRFSTSMPIDRLLRWSSMANYFTFDTIVTSRSEIVARIVKIQRPKRNETVSNFLLVHTWFQMFRHSMRSLFL